MGEARKSHNLRAQKMPKKLNGQNSKAVAAKVRREEKVAAERDGAEREREDAFWHDDDKKREKKRLGALERKKERRELEEEESEAIGGSRGKGDARSPSTQKITQKQIQEIMNEKKKMRETEQKHIFVDQVEEITENVNRLQVDGEEARTMDEAINILSAAGTPASDKNPEKRMKAAYEEFEKNRLPILKVENPNLRLSQLKQLLRKEWMKSPQNPFNQISS